MAVIVLNDIITPKCHTITTKKIRPAAFGPKAAVQKMHVFFLLFHFIYIMVMLSNKQNPDH